MTEARTGAPFWVVAVILLLGTAAIVLLASSGHLPAIEHSWPLLIALVGVAILLFDFTRYLAFGGSIVGLGILVYLHELERISWGRAWPWMLVVIALLVVADRLLARANADQT